MADKVVLEAEIKSNIKSVAKDQKEWNKELKKTKENIEDVNEEGKEVVAEMQILGVSINGLKAAWTSAANGAKFMFKSIKMGIASTGLGVFVLALGSVAAWFKETKAGAEFLERALAGVGAAINVVVDRVAKFGGGLVKLLQGNMEGLNDMKNSFKDIGKEILADTAYTIALKKAQQELIDSNRVLTVETAKQRAEIERLKLIAEDVSKSTKERLQAAKDAFKIEKDLVDRRIENAETELRLQRSLMTTTKINGKNKADELDREAELQVNLFNILQESTTKQIELNNKINAIEAEAQAKRDEAQAKRDEAFEKEKAQNIERTKDLTLMPSIVAKVNDELIQADNEYFKNLEIDNKKKKQLEADLQEFKKEATMQGLSLLEQAAGQGTVIGKAAAIAQATISGVQGVQNAFTAANANIALTAATAGAYPITMATLAGGFAAMNIAKIASGSPPSASGGGGGGGGEMVSQIPAPQMMSGAFELGGGLAPEPMKAFVVTDEMTNSQDQLANIRRQATI